MPKTDEEKKKMLEQLLGLATQEQLIKIIIDFYWSTPKGASGFIDHVSKTNKQIANLMKSLIEEV